MAPFDLTDGWAGRCQQWLALLREDKAAAPLRALLQDMEKQAENLRETTAQTDALRHYRATLRAEVDHLLGRVRADLLSAKHLLRPTTFSADELREESRLCREEAAATADIEMRRALAGRGLDFAMLGEATARLPTVGTKR